MPDSPAPIWHIIITPSGKALHSLEGELILFPSLAEANRWLMPGDTIERYHGPARWGFSRLGERDCADGVGD